MNIDKRATQQTINEAVNAAEMRFVDCDLELETLRIIERHERTHAAHQHMIAKRNH